MTCIQYQCVNSSLSYTTIYCPILWNGFWQIGFSALDWESKLWHLIFVTQWPFLWPWACPSWNVSLYGLNDLHICLLVLEIFARNHSKKISQRTASNKQGQICHRPNVLISKRCNMTVPFKYIRGKGIATH